MIYNIGIYVQFGLKTDLVNVMFMYMLYENRHNFLFFFLLLSTVSCHLLAGPDGYIRVAPLCTPFELKNNNTKKIIKNKK